MTQNIRLDKKAVTWVEYKGREVYKTLNPWKSIEVVITSLTRNQVTGNRPWVRIPPLPPSEKLPIHEIDSFHLFHHGLSVKILRAEIRLDYYTNNLRIKCYQSENIKISNIFRE